MLQKIYQFFTGRCPSEGNVGAVTPQGRGGTSTASYIDKEVLMEHNDTAQSVIARDAAAAMAAAPVKRANQPSFLLDGLSLGFTLFALMDQIRREKARFIVAEPCKPLIDWHKELMNQERPGFLHDPRVSVEFTPALQIARKNPKSFHAILSHSTHERMNLSVAEASDYFAALKQGGLLVITVARPDTRLSRTLQKAGFEVSTEAVPASHKGKKTAFHTVILGKKGRFVPFSAHQS